jgi:DnaJ-domain-containing protein 1
MDNPITIVIFLIICALAGYALYVAGHAFVSGLREAKQKHDPHTAEARASTSSEEPDQQTRGHESSYEEAHYEAKHRHHVSARKPRPWYEVLETSADATLAEIKAAYRQKIALYHPDKVAGLGDELRALAEIHAKEINAAHVFACNLRREHE